MFRTLAILMVGVAGTTAVAQHSAQPKTEGSAPSVMASPATLMITGSVTVNKRTVGEPTSTIFKGDQIETASAAAARLSAPGLSVYLPAKSCVTYSGQELELCNCGSIDVNAMKPVAVIYRDKEVVVSSNEAHSAFTMSVVDRNLQVVNRVGSTEVARNGSILTRLSNVTSRSFAGLGCVGAAAAMLAPLPDVGIGAAALGAPAAISTAVIKKSSQQQPLSSTNP